jgi:hypothetical protein
LPLLPLPLTPEAVNTARKMAANPLTAKKSTPVKAKTLVRAKALTARTSAKVKEAAAPTVNSLCAMVVGETPQYLLK